MQLAGLQLAVWSSHTLLDNTNDLQQIEQLSHQAQAC